MIKLSKEAEKAVKDSRPPAREQVTVEQVPVEPINYDHEVDECIAYFNRRGISLMDYSSEIRHRSFLIEQEFTEAANQDDREKFMKLLQDWRNCFH